MISKSKKLLFLSVVALLVLSITCLCGCRFDAARKPTSETSEITSAQTSEGGETSSPEESGGSVSESESESASQSGEIIEPEEGLPEALTILYQGDSITDANRSRSELTDLGNGYARMVSEALTAAYGNEIEFTFINRANSGWKLIESWNGVSNYEEQFYNYNADITTIFIGYNDIMASTWNNGSPYVSDEVFEEAYDRLLSGLKARGTYAFCIAPFYIFDHLTEYAQTEFAAKLAIVNSLSAKYGFGYIDLNPYMDAALDSGAERMELFGDGTHPIYAANKIIAALVEDAISKHIDKDYQSPLNLGAYERITAESDNDDDLTNARLYVYSSLGDVSYDKTVYLSGEMQSTQSVKLTNRGIESVGAYTKVAFMFDENAKPSMTKGTLQFDVKVENAMPWFSVKAHGNVWTNTSMATSEYGVNLADTNVCTPLGNGWYHVKINLEDWVSRREGNESALNSVKQLIIMMSRGENAAARTGAGVDLNEESAMWIDNLFVSGNPEAMEVSAPYTYNPATFTAENMKDSGKALSFEYKATGESGEDNTIAFTIWAADWHPRMTNLMYLDVVNNALSGVDGTVEPTEDEGWYKVTINCVGMPINVGEGATGNETAGLIYFNVVNHAFLLRNVDFVDADFEEFIVTVEGGEGGGVYSEWDTVTVTATIPEGKIFVEWQEGGEKVSAENPYSFVIHADAALVAVFEDETVSYQVTVENGTGSGRYNEGTEITVNPTVPEGKLFVEWQAGGVKVSENAQYTFEVTGDITLTAIFKDDIHVGARSFAANTASYYWLPDNIYDTREGVAVKNTITIDVKFDDATDGNSLCFRIHKEWGAGDVYFGYYLIVLDSENEIGAYLSSGGAYSSTSATLTAIDDGWYRLTIAMRYADCGGWGANKPSDTVDCIFIPGNGWTNASGKIEYMGFEEVVIPTYTVTVNGGEGSGTYEEDAEATVTATIPEGKLFVEWQVGGEKVSENATYTFTVTGNVELTAIFEDITIAYNVTVVGGEGSGTYNENTEVTVTATIPEGKLFVEWQTGGEKVSENATYTFTVTEDVTLTAIFEGDPHAGAVAFNAENVYYWLPDNDYNNRVGVAVKDKLFIDIKFDDTTNGNAICFRIQTLWGEGNMCFGNYHIALNSDYPIGAYVAGNTWYSNSDGVTLTLMEDGWYRFTLETRYAGCGTAYGGLPTGAVDCVFITSQNGWTNTSGLIKYMGYEEVVIPTYTVTVEGGEGGGSYEEGAEATVTATIPEGKLFVEWQISGVKVSENATYTFTVTENVELSAVFEDEIPETKIILTSGFEIAVPDYDLSIAETLEFDIYLPASNGACCFKLYYADNTTSASYRIGVYQNGLDSGYATTGATVVKNGDDNYHFHVTFDLSKLPAKKITKLVHNTGFPLNTTEGWIDNIEVK